MFSIDGVEIDLTKPGTLKGTTLKPGGFMEQRKDGVTTKLTHQPWCASLNILLLSLPPQPAPCNCARVAALEQA